MIRKRIAALAVASTVALGAATIDTPTAVAEPEQPAPEAAQAQLSSGGGMDEVKKALSAMIAIPLGLSSIGLGLFAPQEYTCEGLVPYLCFDKHKK